MRRDMKCHCLIILYISHAVTMLQFVIQLGKCYKLQLILDVQSANAKSENFNLKFQVNFAMNDYFNR